MANSAPTPVITDFGSLAGLRTQARANDPAALKKAAQQFEALFTQQLLKASRTAKLGDDVLGGGQTEFYQDIFDQQMALHLSTGKGLGLADMLVKQMQGMQGVAPADAQSMKVAPLNHALPATRAAVPSDVHGIEPPAAASADAQAFVDQLRPHAERAAKELGVPAHAILAQAAIETGWGRHVPTNADGTPSHNYFGIKASHAWSGDTTEKTTTEYIGGRLQKVSATFRSYGSVGEAFDDYVSFLKSNPRYAQALGSGDAKHFAVGLQSAGYATDPAYSGKLLKVAQGPSLSAALSTPSAEAAPRATHRVRTWSA
jgi:flagellar protein FlgJ